MSTLSEKIITLALDQTEFQNDDAETAVEGVLLAYGAVYAAALKLDVVAGDNEEAQRIAGGVVDLANQFGLVFSDLESEGAEKVKQAVRDIVTGAQETEIEAIFDATLNVVVKLKNLAAVINGIANPE